MTTTARVSNITNAGWTELANGSENVLVDLDLNQVNVPDVLIRVDTAAPAAGVVDGFRLDRHRRTFPFAGLAGTDKVYARSTGAVTSVLVAKS